MFKNDEYIENLDTIFEDLKFSTNSFIRLKILACLYEKPQNMKEMTDKTGLSYSSVSSNVHDLELKNLVCRERNKYFLTNSARVRINDVLELKRMIILLNKFFNILDGHLVDMIPNESVFELYMLGKAKLMESSGVDAYRIYNYVENCLARAQSVKCIMPFYYEPFFIILADLISNNRDVEILAPHNLVHLFERKSKIKNISPFREYDAFLLIVTDEEMILGLFMDDGRFDQNRLLTSKDDSSIEWANRLFEKFKDK